MLSVNIYQWKLWGRAGMGFSLCPRADLYSVVLWLTLIGRWSDGLELTAAR